MNKLTINFPFIYYAHDYHEFDELSYTIGKISGKEPKFIELNKDEVYLAVFYLGRRPDKETIDKLYNDYKK